jgi:uncharacterized protein (TIGR00266 family)
MTIETKFNPTGTVAIFNLSKGETLTAEAGAFMAMTGAVNFETTTRQRKGSNILSGLRRLLAGESFFINKFTAASDAQIYLGTALPGDIFVKKLNGEKLIIQGGSYVACESGIDIDVEWQGLKSLFSGESLFWVKAKGVGQVVVNTFGFLYPVQVDGEYIVDTGHIVAFEETLNFTISKASPSWFSAFFSGEGFICRFKGRGTVWCQSHSPRNFGLELRRLLRPKQ